MVEQLKYLYRFWSKRFQTVQLDYPVEFKPRHGHGNPPHPELQQLISERDTAYLELLEACCSLAQKHLVGLERDQDPTDPMRPYWENDFLPGLDIVSLFCFLERFKPKNYLEIGSGNSTMVAHHARSCFGLDTKIISIDPVPRAGIDRISDEVVREKFEDVAEKRAIHEELEPGDILYIDNSHRSLPNSDVTVCFLELIPRLKPGVIVHVHDIYLPHDYPQFMCDRAYNEQYLLAVLLLANPAKYQVLLPNFYVSQHDHLKTILNPFWSKLSWNGVERHGGSFWFVVN